MTKFQNLLQKKQLRPETQDLDCNADYEQVASQKCVTGWLDSGRLWRRGTIREKGGGHARIVGTMGVDD